MDCIRRWNEESKIYKERFDLSMERIESIRQEETVVTPWRDFFREMADFLLLIREYSDVRTSGMFEKWTAEECQKMQYRLYKDILPGQYEDSYGNPSCAVKRLGDGYGQILSFLYTQLRGEIIFAARGRLGDITICNELFIEIYNLFESGEEASVPSFDKIKDVIYWFFSDYSDITMSMRIQEMLDPKEDCLKKIIMECDLTDIRYLYDFGDYISDTETEMAAFLADLPEDTIRLMAETFAEGYIKGFEVTGKDLWKKRNVVIRYEIGFERMVREAVHIFENRGLHVIIYPAPVWSSDINNGRKAGVHASSPNRQYEYDHRFDQALYYDKAFKERRLGILKSVYEDCSELAADYAGPAVIETFGDEPFKPQNKKESLKLSSKQEKLILEYSNEAMPVMNNYIPGDETSFTIIAFPIPRIGPDFPQIFEETIKINTLDYEKYRKIQQCIIDTLDLAQCVTISGAEDNETDLKIYLHVLEQPEKQTNFENCVSDVNIPLGEVFTSPVLSGTSGLLHVKNVYIGDIRFEDLKITFRDGMVTDYSCANFKDLKEGRELIRQVILHNRETLPMGEFAVGTNTTAYAMAIRFDIFKKLPILIAEKMGPHFAVGDTCYSWAEDNAVYNPDGKEIIARDNEISILRKTNPDSAYFGCHTDITIPYDELDALCAIDAEGVVYPIIENGRFSLEGTEELNDPLEE